MSSDDGSMERSIAELGSDFQSTAESAVQVDGDAFLFLDSFSSGSEIPAVDDGDTDDGSFKNARSSADRDQRDDSDDGGGSSDGGSDGAISGVAGLSASFASNVALSAEFGVASSGDGDDDGTDDDDDEEENDAGLLLDPMGDDSMDVDSMGGDSTAVGQAVVRVHVADAGSRFCLDTEHPTMTSSRKLGLRLADASNKDALKSWDEMVCGCSRHAGSCYAFLYSKVGQGDLITQRMRRYQKSVNANAELRAGLDGGANAWTHIARCSISTLGIGSTLPTKLDRERPGPVQA